jgi:hypothetical protein
VRWCAAGGARPVPRFPVRSRRGSRRGSPRRGLRRSRSGSSAGFRPDSSGLGGFRAWFVMGRWLGWPTRLGGHRCRIRSRGRGGRRGSSPDGLASRCTGRIGLGVSAAPPVGRYRRGDSVGGQPRRAGRDVAGWSQESGYAGVTAGRECGGQRVGALAHIGERYGSRRGTGVRQPNRHVAGVLCGRSRRAGLERLLGRQFEG